MFKPWTEWDMKLQHPGTSSGPSSVASPFSDGTGDVGSPVSEASLPETHFESNWYGYRRTPTPELWLDYFEPEPARGDKLLAMEVDQFIMGSRIYDLQTERFEDDTIWRPEERFFEEHMTRRDGFAVVG